MGSEGLLHVKGIDSGMSGHRDRLRVSGLIKKLHDLNGCLDFGGDGCGHFDFEVYDAGPRRVGYANLVFFFPRKSIVKPTICFGVGVLYAKFKRGPVIWVEVVTNEP